jgi:hypothetical protein
MDGSALHAGIFSTMEKNTAQIATQGLVMSVHGVELSEQLKTRPQQLEIWRHKLALIVIAKLGQLAL